MTLYKYVEEILVCLCIERKCNDKNYRCVNSIGEQVTPKGFKQLITEFSLKNGKRGTEIITTLDTKGNKGIRTIERDCFGYPEKVTDKVYGRVEVYVPAPDSNIGVIQKVEGRPDVYFRNITMDKLCQY